MSAGAPSIPSLLVSHWQPAWLPSCALVALAILYLAAAARVRDRWPWWRTAAFAAGLLAIALAVDSGIAAYDDELLSVHMVQHLLLLEVAPALLLAGSPALLALRVLPRAPRRRLGRVLLALRPLGSPVLTLGAFTVVVLATHLPPWFDATLRHPLLHDAEHALYLLVGLLLWWPLLGGDPAPRARLGGLAQVVYLIVAMLPMTLIGAYLNRDQSVFYGPYAQAARALHVSAVVDQQQGGAIMWVLGTSAMIAIGLWSAMAAMAAAERRQRAREAYLIDGKGGG